MARGWRRAATALLLGCVAAGCSMIPPQIACHEVQPSVCERMAQALLRRSSGNNPSHRVVRIDVLDDQGSYTITYDDGTGESMIVD